MRWLIKSAVIVDPLSSHHGQTKDILIEDGIIKTIKSKISDGKAEKINFADLHVSPGFVDLKANFREPGTEYKEGIWNGLDAAAKGGFSHVVTMPDTTPPIAGRADVEYLLRRSNGHTVQLHPAAAMSAQLKGKQLSEMFDMQQGGAVFFTDNAPVERTELMKRALEYANNFGAVIASLPCDADLNGKGVVHEGTTSTQNGLKGIPVLSETIRLMRDIALLKYTGGKLHVLLVSSAEGVELIRKAKKDGAQITCAVSANHLYFNDSALEGFDANLKVIPPLRSESDRKALVKAVKEGVIDAICSDHQPEDVEHKNKEFEQASFGIGAIEHTFSAALNAGLTLEQCIQALAISPREVLNIPHEGIEEGSSVDLVLYNPNESHQVEKDNLVSKAWNNPYIGKTMKGAIYGVFREDSSLIF
jgi:dihydroorotase